MDEGGQQAGFFIVQPPDGIKGCLDTVSQFPQITGAFQMLYHRLNTGQLFLIAWHPVPLPKADHT